MKSCPSDTTVTVERTAMLYTAAVYALVGLLLVLASMCLDYAKIAMVAETRSSAILAFIRGIRFFLARPVQTLALYLLILLTGAVLVAVYALVAPGPGQANDFTLVAAFLVSQCYFLARIFLKLWFLGAQTLYFQAEPERSAVGAAAAGLPDSAAAA